MDKFSKVLLAMDKFSKVLLAIHNACTVPQRALICGPSLGGLNQVYGPNHPTPSVQSICGKYNIFARCANKNLYAIVMAAVADVSKGQTDMSYKGGLQTLTKLSMRHQVCPGETCHMAISESTLTMLMSRGRNNCGVTYCVSRYY